MPQGRRLFLTLHSTDRQTIHQCLDFVAAHREADVDGAKGKLRNTLRRVFERRKYGEHKTTHVEIVSEIDD